MKTEGIWRTMNSKRCILALLDLVALASPTIVVPTPWARHVRAHPSHKMQTACRFELVNPFQQTTSPHHLSSVYTTSFKFHLRENNNLSGLKRHQMGIVMSRWHQSKKWWWLGHRRWRAAAQPMEIRDWPAVEGKKTFGAPTQPNNQHSINSTK